MRPLNCAEQLREYLGVPFVGSERGVSGAWPGKAKRRKANKQAASSRRINRVRHG